MKDYQRKPTMKRNIFGQDCDDRWALLKGLAAALLFLSVCTALAWIAAGAIA